jgi:quercetin dioxygenase-like cupin family protein
MAELNQLQHVNWSDVPVESLNPLLGRQFVVGERMMIARVLLKKGCVVPMHSHFNEQLTHIQSGALQFNIDGKEVIVRPGEWLVIPPDVPHSALALEDTVDIDIFTPPRQDWIDKTDQYLRAK